MTEFNSSTSTMIKDLKELCHDSTEGMEVDLAFMLAKTTLGVIAKVAFGLDSDASKCLHPILLTIERQCRHRV